MIIIVAYVLGHRTIKFTLYSLSQIMVQVSWPAATPTIAMVSACKVNIRVPLVRQGPLWMRWAHEIVRAR